MTIDGGRVRAVVRKELREYRRNRFIVGSMSVTPLLFLAAPLVNVFAIPSGAPSARVQGTVGAAFLLMLVTPVFLPSVIAAYSVIGERDQGTLEPLLTTPVRREELVLGKAFAAAAPAVALGYLLFVAFIVAVKLGTTPAVVSAVWQAPQFVAEILYAPLLATWSTWMGLALSARSSDVRVAQQLGTLASLPALGVTILVSFRVINPTVSVAVLFGVGFALLDVVAWRVATAMLDRERLITGRRAG